MTVHAHRQWTGNNTMLLWCGIEADFSAGARQTTDLISCVQCAQASWTAWRGM